jgi:hypothetical protein
MISSVFHRFYQGSALFLSQSLSILSRYLVPRFRVLHCDPELVNCDSELVNCDSELVFNFSEDLS